MNDTTQTLLRSVIKIGAGYLASKGIADQSNSEIFLSVLFGLFAIAWGVLHRRKPLSETSSPTLSNPLSGPGFISQGTTSAQRPPPPPAQRPPGTFLFSHLLAPIFYLLLLGSTGCAYNCAKLYDPTGNLLAKSRTYTIFDSHSSLAKLHIDTAAATNSHGTFPPGISIAGLDQQTTSTNLVEALRLVGAILQSLPK